MGYRFNRSHGSIYVSDNHVSLHIRNPQDEEITLSINLDDNELSFYVDCEFERDMNPPNGDIGFILPELDDDNDDEDDDEEDEYE